MRTVLKAGQNAGKAALAYFLMSAIAALPIFGVAGSGKAVSSFAESFPQQLAEAKSETPETGVLFEENRGQHDERVKFTARSAGGTMFLTNRSAVYVMRIAEPVRSEGLSTEKFEHPDEISRTPQKFFALHMNFIGANEATEFRAGELAETRTNYFKGNNERDWQTDIPNHRSVRVAEMYPGIDVLWQGESGGQTRYDMIVKPDASPGTIEIEFDGADSLRVDKDGSLLIETPAGVVRHNKPFSFQTVNGIQREVESWFEVIGKRVRFGVGDYDRSIPLTIDPTVSLNNLAFSTFLGSFGDDIANALDVDQAGCVYVTGRTTSVSFPTTAGTFDTTANGSEDVFITKFNSSGTGVVFSTYLGGTFFDEGRGIKVDQMGNIYVAGAASIVFPVSGGAFDETFNGGSDAFVTKLNPSGSALIYSTYIGASGIDTANALAIDSGGHAYIAVRTTDEVVDYPTTPGAFDTTHNGFDDVAVTKLNPTGSALVYSSFLGGGSIDVPTGIVVNSNGEAFVGGSTADHAVPLQTTPGAFDTTHNGVNDFFVTKFNAAGSALIYSTFIGGSGIDNANSIALDQGGSIYIAGTGGVGFPTTAGVVDAVNAGSSELGVSKLNPDGTALVYSTFIGGNQGETAWGIAVDAHGNAYITGSNFGGDYPTTAGAYDTTFNGSNDVILTVLNLNATAFLYSTYVGGGGNDAANAITLDWAGNAYICGRSVFNAAAYPTSGDAYQTFYSGSNDAFVTKFGDFAIGGRVIDTIGNPLANVMVAMSGQVSGNMMTGADGRFSFVNTVRGEPHSISAMRAGYSINPAILNISALNNNRELVFIGTIGSPTGGSGGTLRVDSLSVSKSENGGSVNVVVKRTGDVSSQTPVTVDYSTSDITAIAGQDYQPVSGVLSFSSFESIKTISVPIQNDDLLEPRETFSFTLSNPTNNSDIEEGRETMSVHILDEDLKDGSLQVSEFRLRGNNGPRDEYIKIFNPNDFDITVNTADGSAGLALVRMTGLLLETIAHIPNLVTVPARGHYMFTNNNPQGGFSIIDFPTGTGSTTLVGDRTFSADIPDNSDIALLSTAESKNFGPSVLISAAGFGNSNWTTEGRSLPWITPENSEFSFVRKMTTEGPVQTKSNLNDFILLDGSRRIFVGEHGKMHSVLGSPAPGTTDSLRSMKNSEVSITETLSADWNTTPVANGPFGTYTIYRQITNNTDSPILSLRLRATDFPTLGSFTQMRTSARPDFRLLSSMGDDNSVKGTTLAAERLQPLGGGINSTLVVDSITPTQPLGPGESIVVAIRFGVVRYGRMRFHTAIEALH